MDSNRDIVRKLREARLLQERTDYNNMESNELIKLAKDGDQLAISTLFDKHKDLLFKSTYKYFSGDSTMDKEDLNQIANIGFWKAIESWDGSGDFEAYAGMLIKRQITDEIRKLNTDKRYAGQMSQSMNAADEDDDDSQLGMNKGDRDTLVSYSHQSAEDEYIDQERVKALSDFLATELTEQERQVIDLYIEGYKMAKISEVTGMKYKSCENALRRAKGKLMEYMRGMQESKILKEDKESLFSDAEKQILRKALGMIGESVDEGIGVGGKTIWNIVNPITNKPLSNIDTGSTYQFRTKEEAQEFIDSMSHVSRFKGAVPLSRVAYSVYHESKEINESDDEDVEYFEYKGITVERDGSKWIDSNGNFYMGYLTPRDIKIWIDKDSRNYESKEIKESAVHWDEVEYPNDEFGPITYKEHKHLEIEENGYSEDDWNDSYEKMWRGAAKLLNTDVNNLVSISDGNGELPGVENEGSPVEIRHDNDPTSDRLWLAQWLGMHGVHCRDGYGFSSFFVVDRGVNESKEINESLNANGALKKLEKVFPDLTEKYFGKRIEITAKPDSSSHPRYIGIITPDDSADNDFFNSIIGAKSGGNTKDEKYQKAQSLFSELKSFGISLDRPRMDYASVWYYPTNESKDINESKSEPSKEDLESALQYYRDNAFGYGGIKDYVDTDFAHRDESYKKKVMDYLRKNESKETTYTDDDYDDWQKGKRNFGPYEDDPEIPFPNDIDMEEHLEVSAGAGSTTAEKVAYVKKMVEKAKNDGDEHSAWDIVDFLWDSMLLDKIPLEESAASEEVDECDSKPTLKESIRKRMAEASKGKPSASSDYDWEGLMIDLGDEFKRKIGEIFDQYEGDDLRWGPDRFAFDVINWKTGKSVDDFSFVRGDGDDPATVEKNAREDFDYFIQNLK